jgi:hypothetical protein
VRGRLDSTSLFPFPPFGLALLRFGFPLSFASHFLPLAYQPLILLPSYSFSVPLKPVVIKPHSSATIPIHFTPRNTIGLFQSTLLLSISVFPFVPSSGAPNDIIFIQRSIRGTVGSASDAQQYGATEPFVPKEKRRRLPRAQDKEVVRAPREADANFKQNVPWVGTLPLFRSPPFLKTN